MTQERSIYDLIKENIVDGKLREGFSLPRDEKEGVGFADGAMDGISVYHMGPYEITDDDKSLIERSLVTVSKGDCEQTDAIWAKLGKNARAIKIVDQFQELIREHADEIDVKTAYKSVYEILCSSAEKESIKFALEFMELLDTEIDFVKKAVRHIGLSDEFTVFAVWIMRGWENGNKEVFELAKKVNGWGKIHAIEMLLPETEEIRNWLLTEGTKNDILYSYSALTCWDKSGAEHRLTGKLTHEGYNGVLTLVNALTDEGPISGISEIENADELVSEIIDRSEEYTLTIDEYEIIRQIYTWSENEEGYKKTSTACQTVLFSDKCRSTIESQMDQGKYTELKKLTEKQ